HVGHVDLAPAPTRASCDPIGFLDAVTAEERARVAEPDGQVVETPVEPMTNYMVGSLARDFRRGMSTVGMLFTATHRRLGGDGALDRKSTRLNSSHVKTSYA